MCLLLLLFFISSISYGQTGTTIDDKENYTAAINKQFDKGNWEAGKAILEKRIKEYPQDSDLRVMLGKYYHHIKQYDKARFELSKALEITPTNLDAKRILVNVEMESKRYSSAICYVNELLEVSPYLKSLWKRKIELYELQGNHLEAERLKKRLYQIYSTDSTFKQDYVYAIEKELNQSRKSGDLDKSIALSKKLIAELPNEVDYYLAVINDYLKGGDKHNALAFTDRGLFLFPQNEDLIHKKIGILEEQKRYDELLVFLNANKMKTQYEYYVLEAARNAKLQEPFTLYSKILSNNPSNEEAFTYVFNHLMGTQQCEEALEVIVSYNRVKKTSKSSLLKELKVYSCMGNTAKVTALTKQLYSQYGEDKDIAVSYEKMIVEEAKGDMFDERYDEAIRHWLLISNSSDAEIRRLAQLGLYNAYVAKKEYSSALGWVNKLVIAYPQDSTLRFKKADLYLKQKNYLTALSTYEEVFVQTAPELRTDYFQGYEELCIAIIKSQNEDFLYQESLHIVKRWLMHDATNRTALKYAFTLSLQVKKTTEEAKVYVERGVATYPEDVFFKVKLIELQGNKVEDYAEVYATLVQELKTNPYHELLLNTYADVSEKYGLQLIKEQQSQRAIEKLDEALGYLPNNKELKYTKGLAFEKQKKFAEAHYYQSFYEPSLLDLDDFKQHLQFLNAKAAKNEIGLMYLLSKFENESNTSRSFTSFEYTRLEINNSYTARVHYTGREDGKGIQGHLDWAKKWGDRFTSKVDVAFADAYFPKVVVNGSVFKSVSWFGGLEFEVGGGYRKLQVDTENLDNKDQMSNLVFGVTKEADLFRVNLRFNNFFMGSEWMYNLALTGRYYLASPKNYITALAGIGSSPDAELIDYQLYNGFSVLNTTIGGGFGRMLYKNVSTSLMGTWYNYKSGDKEYKNLYNFYLTIHVVF